MASLSNEIRQKVAELQRLGVTPTAFDVDIETALRLENEGLTVSPEVVGEANPLSSDIAEHRLTLLGRPMRKVL